MLHFVAGTGTAEPGGWTSRELLSILDGLDGLEVVGADGRAAIDNTSCGNHAYILVVVEVSPIYDSPGEPTVLAAAQVANSLLELMIEKPVRA